MSQNSFDNLKNLIAERNKRDSESLKLFRPMKHQEPFFETDCLKRILRGGNRSSKSTVAAVEFAHAATGIPVHKSTGEAVRDKYPRKNPLILWVIGYDLDHVARNIYRLLFQPGCFKLIKDAKTGMARAFKPWDPEDNKRAKEAYPAPPLIPERLIQEFAWENKAQRVFKACRLNNGNEIRAFSSQGKEPQGDQCDVIWIDEDVENPELIMESTMRLADRGGRMFWSAFPKAKNFALRRLSEEAASTDPNNPTCREFVFRMSDNPYLDNKTRESILAGMTGDERRARDFGEYLDDLVAVYPTFDIDIHCTPAKTPEDNDPIDKAIAENGGAVPDDWTRYLVLDPGHARPAVLMAAVPPPELEQPGTSEPTIVCYDEIAIPRIDASRLAAEVLAKTKGQHFEAFIIDSHAGRQTAMGRGETNQDHYAAAFEGAGLRSRLTRSSFAPASDDVVAGIQMVRRRMAVRKHGRPGLRIIAGNCPNLCRQIEDYKKTVSARNVVDDRPAKFQIDDLADDLRYLVSFEPQYRKPEKTYEELSPAYREWLRIQQKKNRERTGAICLGPIGGAA